MPQNETLIDLKPIQVTTPEDSMLSFSWLVEPDTKYAPHRWKTDIVIPNSPRAIEIGEQLDTFFLNFKKAIVAAYPDKTPEQLKKIVKWNDLPYEWGPYLDKEGNKRQGFPADDYLILSTNKKTHSPDGTKAKSAPMIFDSTSKTPLNDEEKKKYTQIGPGTTAQVALYVSQYHLGVGTGIRLTPAAVNIKKFIPFGEQAKTADDFKFTVDAPQQGSGTPSTNDFDF
tara:strand:- start:589 stop:1269 length:681 start_codon:yes stop_codon:yes gene_type:complete